MLGAGSSAFVQQPCAWPATTHHPPTSAHLLVARHWPCSLAALRNLFENTAAVQFNHRMLAYTTLGGVAATWAYASRLPTLPRAARLCVNALALATAGQVALGITTLLTYVPVPLGAAHQGGAMVLFTLALGLLYSIKPAPSLGTFRRVHGGCRR